MTVRSCYDTEHFHWILKDPVFSCCSCNKLVIVSKVGKLSFLLCSHPQWWGVLVDANFSFSLQGNLLGNRDLLSCPVSPPRLISFYWECKQTGFAIFIHNRWATSAVGSLAWQIEVQCNKVPSYTTRCPCDPLGLFGFFPNWTVLSENFKHQI